MENNLNLNEIRDEINEVDKKVVELLEKRFNLALKVGQYKISHSLPVFDEKREQTVIKNCTEMLQDKKYHAYLEKIYIEIMNTCKDIQKNEIKIM